MIVAFEGVQPLDAVGPHEVFAGAGRAAASLGRAGGYRVTLASPGGAAVRAESGLVLGTSPLPEAPSASTPWCSPAGTGAEAAAAATRRCSSGSARRPRAAGAWPPCARGPSSAPRPGCFDGRRVTTHWARARQLAEAYPDLEVDADPIYIRDGKYWSSAGVTAGIDLVAGAGPGGPRRRRRPDRGPLARHVPAPARRADAVRVAGLGPPGRALDRPGRADPRRGGARVATTGCPPSPRPPP